MTGQTDREARAFLTSLVDGDYHAEVDAERSFWEDQALKAQARCDALRAEVERLTPPTPREMADCLDAGGTVERQRGDGSWTRTTMTAGRWRNAVEPNVARAGFRCVWPDAAPPVDEDSQAQPGTKPAPPETERVPWWEAVRDARTLPDWRRIVSGGPGDIGPWVRTRGAPWALTEANADGTVEVLLINEYAAAEADEAREDGDR